jgi:hypothetical protein
MHPAVTFGTIPSDGDRNRAIGQWKETAGIGMIAAGIACAGGVIAGVGGGTGDWGAAVGGASGLFFGLAGSGLYLYVTGRELVRGEKNTDFVHIRTNLQFQ